jgi:hypothetical protein
LRAIIPAQRFTCGGEEVCCRSTMAATSSPRIPAQRLLEFITTLASSSENAEDFLEKHFPVDSSSLTSSGALNETSPLSNEFQHSLLQIIQQELLLINEIYEQSSETSNSKQTSQSNLLSISHLRGIYTGLELLWSWGVSPYLILNNDLPKEAVPKSILIQAKLIPEVSDRIKATAGGRGVVPNVEMIVLIFRTCTCHMFRGMMIERNFKRVLCACISILCHCTPQTLPMIDPATLQQSRFACQNVLNRVIMDPLVSPENSLEQNVDVDRCTTIESLRYVSRCGTPVMQHIVGSLLTMILIQPDGLRATLSVYLSGK